MNSDVPKDLLLQCKEPLENETNITTEHLTLLMKRDAANIYEPLISSALPLFTGLLDACEK